jgi:hypothetical protein
MIADMHSSNGWQSPWHTQRGGKCCGWYSLPHTQGGGKCKTAAAGIACRMPKRGQMRTERWWNNKVGKPKELWLKPVTVRFYPPFIPLLGHQSPASVVKDKLNRMVTPVSL